jgi:hypothetical protein
VGRGAKLQNAINSILIHAKVFVVDTFIKSLHQPGGKRILNGKRDKILAVTFTM